VRHPGCAGCAIGTPATSRSRAEFFVVTIDATNLCVGDTDCHAVAPAPLEALALLSKRRLGNVRDFVGFAKLPLKK